jgi:hypothetical protein
MLTKRELRSIHPGSTEQTAFSSPSAYRHHRVPCWGVLSIELRAPVRLELRPVATQLLHLNLVEEMLRDRVRTSFLLLRHSHPAEPFRWRLRGLGRRPGRNTWVEELHRPGVEARPRKAKLIRRQLGQLRRARTHPHLIAIGHLPWRRGPMHLPLFCPKRAIEHRLRIHGMVQNQSVNLARLP